MKSCELCKSPARIYCESDQASLCWSCDAKVHSANFLVARHSRSLLCQLCQSPTPWSASGEKLGPSTVSVCEKCVVDGESDNDEDREESGGDNDDDEYDGDEDGEDEIELDDEEDGDDNQVVPLSSTPPPPASSSSSSEEFSIGDRGGSVKRKRWNVADLSSEDDLECSSVQRSHREPSQTAAATIGGEISSKAIVEKLNNIRHQRMISGDKSDSIRAVGFDLNSSP